MIALDSGKSVQRGLGVLLLILGLGSLILGIGSSACSPGEGAPAEPGGSLYLVESAPYFPIGAAGGPFVPSFADYTLRNASAETVGWSVQVTEPWLQVVPTAGHLASGEDITLTVSIDPGSGGAGELAPGSYGGRVEIQSGAGSSHANRIPVTLEIPFGSGEGFPYFEKTSGVLDYLGVSVARTSSSQTVWAPGSPHQEYPGGWVTPGDYTVELNTPRIHHDVDGSPTGQQRPGDTLLGTVVTRDLTDPGWINHGFDEPAQITPQEWGASRAVTLVAGDVLHVAYGNVIVPFQKRNGSDGIVVHCVAEEPEYRGGLWGTGRSTWSQEKWNVLKSRILAAAELYEVETSNYGYGPAALPVPIPADFENVSGQTDNRQAQTVSRYLQNRAFDKLQSGAAWTGDLDELNRLFEFFCNNPQLCFMWGDSAAQHYHYTHGFNRYPPYQLEPILGSLVAAVALGYDPDYEPLYRVLTHMGQRLDVTLSHSGSYNYRNNMSDNGLASHRDDDEYTQWLWYDLGHTDMMFRGTHRINVWGPCLWARELLGWPESPATSDMLSKSGHGPSGTDHGHEWSETGAGAGYNSFYAMLEVEGTMWLWFTGTQNHSQHSRWSRRNYLYKGVPGAIITEPGTYFARWTQHTFVDEPVGLTGSIAGSGVRLTWMNVAEPDLDHYRVYRGTGASKLTLLANDVAQPTFFDENTVKGAVHRYAISAVDEDGNENSISDQASVQLP